MRGVAYTGNNMRKTLSAQLVNDKPIKPIMKAIYHSYNTPKSKQRARTSWVPRPNYQRGSTCKSAQVN